MVINNKQKTGNINFSEISQVLMKGTEIAAHGRDNKNHHIDGRSQSNIEVINVDLNDFIGIGSRIRASNQETTSPVNNNIINHHGND